MSGAAERLGEIADELDAIESKAEGLYSERRRLWREQMAAGSTAVQVAALSRVRPVTVRQLLARAGEEE